MQKEIDPEKLLDMIRSILPSKERVRARKRKAWLNRHVRRGVRAALRGDRTKSFSAMADHRITVEIRRGADKLNHFMRWCEHITEGMSAEERLAYVRGILPHDVIGEHAYVHWQYHVRYILYRAHSTPYREELRRRAQSEYDRTRFALRRALKEAPHLVGEMNAEIKTRKKPEKPRRLLFGMHDLDAFVREILSARHFGIEREIVKRITQKDGRPPAAARHHSSPRLSHLQSAA